jgi:hypothetical protein
MAKDDLTPELLAEFIADMDSEMCEDDWDALDIVNGLLNRETDNERASE